jgi:hypothetical protein
MDTNYNYLTLLNIISSNANREDQLYIDNNKDVILENLKKFSNYMNDIIRTFSEKKNYKEVFKTIKKKYSNILNSNEIKNIINTLQLKNLKGGEADKILNIKKKIDDDTIQICLDNLPVLLIKLMDPRIFMMIISNLFQYLSELLTFNVNWFDYTKRLDWVYLILFLSASIPFAGGIADIVIIFKALKDERFYLAMITGITFLISTLLTMHAVDLGVLFKLFYYLDNKSYVKELERIDNGGNKYTNDLEQEVTFYDQDGNVDQFGEIHNKVLQASMPGLKKRQLQKLEMKNENEKIMKDILDKNQMDINGDNPEDIDKIIKAIKDNKEVGEHLDKDEKEEAIKKLEEMKSDLETSENYDPSQVDRITQLRNKIEKAQFDH